MQTIGIDVGKRQHVAAICHEGEREARRAAIARIAPTPTRAPTGPWRRFESALDALLARANIAA